MRSKKKKIEDRKKKIEKMNEEEKSLLQAGTPKCVALFSAMSSASLACD